MERTVNRELLKQLAVGRRAEIAFKAKCSESLISKLISGDRNAPRESIRVLMCKALGVKMDDLFPWTEAA
ncbi:MAG: hypothetical protein CL674_14555 [Bdellovibrionaceae bacterium]|jgi:transcriptional regulator with XRE-family HTH domain|nr:hypothetical protein [Pseudobdellovibrionaceae bacterium]MAF92488.1 hypothetical protein [Pseudobdellovibrionaceae bacterium]QDP47580.1 MAG: hypothetical protein GOVbin1174_28 [Prokaryotic dsDNA virus sp.]|tara:strand:+ start:28688 stop:28897 length:210 start_codon:yes stop_codon:yes gene_type:complete